MRGNLLLALPLALAATPALADVGQMPVSGLAAGLAHPLLGADHALAITAAGLWAAMSGRRAALAWPAAFLGAMVVGGTLAIFGVALPLVEPAILVSVVVLGACVGLSVGLSPAAGAALLAVFGLFHGHAHGAELPLAAGPSGYVAGFVVATAALLAVGLGLGGGLRRFSPRHAAPRLLGWVVGAAGLALAAG